MIKNLRFKFLITLFFFALFATNAIAGSGDKDRFRTCSPLGGSTSNDNPKPSDLDYSPLNGGDDFSFDEANGYCWTVVGPLYGAVKITIPIMNRLCASGSTIPRPTPRPIQDSQDIIRATINCAANHDPRCCSAISVAYAELGSFIAGMRIQYEVAQAAYQGSALCGGGNDDNWMRWHSQSMNRDIPDKKTSVENQIKTWVAECNSDPTSSTCASLSNGLNQREYRQWYYGGVEREDISDNACPDVTRAAVDGENIVTYGDKTYPAQKYYLRGTEPGNYACERFNYRLNKSDPLNNNSPLSELRIKDYDYAYRCCQNKSKSSVCIERKYCTDGVDIIGGNCLPENIITKHKFCQAGSQCSIGPGANKIIYSANYQDNDRMVCVNTVNLCPYDFNLGGGSVQCDYYKDGNGTGNDFVAISTTDIANQTCDTKSEIRNADCSFNEKAGKCRNYCQHLNHCVIVGGTDYIYDSEISSPYFSNACLNFIGDSKNEYGYGQPTGAGDTSITGVQKHFTAPMAQCVRETLENVFYNRAGHSKCGNINEFPDANGNCFTNFYQYQAGQNVADESFFFYIQDHLKDAIKLILTVSIMMHGFKILLTGTPFKHSELITYIVKIGLVLFFATGTAWQGFFFDGVYNASSTFSTIVMNIKTSPLEIQRDGCQFGNIKLPDGTSENVSEYPKGKEYLAVFDTFDCKIARYLGFGPSATVANIAKIILPALISPAVGAIGIYFALLTMAFGFFMIAACFRALHIFLTSAFAIILLVYVSPITITAILFAKTKPLFDRWLNNLIGYSLQPIILFAYMGFFITIFETLVTGSATFTGKAPQKEIVCDKVCVDKDGNVTVLQADDGLGGIINDINQNVINPAVNGVIDNVINPAADSLGASGINGINGSNSAPICNLDAGSKIFDPMSDSVACMMNLKNKYFGKIPVLEPLGIGLPILKDFFTNNGRQKILAMTKAVLIIYILASFMDEIPGIASSLMGGNTLPESKIYGAEQMAKKVGKLIGAVQKRGAGATRKIGSKIAARAKSAARSAGVKKNDDDGGD
ncbi:MAG: type IV secretion system protein [Pseudomonadota bacterium]